MGRRLVQPGVQFISEWAWFGSERGMLYFLRAWLRYVHAWFSSVRAWFSSIGGVVYQGMGMVWLRAGHGIFFAGMAKICACMV